MNTIETIKNQLESHDIVLYMKGTPQFPQCGFSARVVQALKAVDADYFSVNVLENPDIRQALPEYAKWPTFPQLYIKGELIGGCDIICDLQEKGELVNLVSAIA